MVEIKIATLYFSWLQAFLIPRNTQFRHAIFHPVLLFFNSASGKMNIFRFFGDLSHLVSILILIYNMQQRRSSAGISFKTQCLYTAVFVLRYLGICALATWLTRDLFWSWISLYNTVMKIFFIGSSIYILYLMKGPFRPTHDPNLDTFKIEYLLVGSAIASLLFHYDWSMSEV